MGNVDAALQGVPSNSRDEFVQQALQGAGQELTPSLLLKSLLVGGALGTGWAGLRSLSKVIKRSKPVPATYTLPIEADIYAPREEKTAKPRKVASFVSDLSGAVAEPTDSLKFLATAGAGAGLGYAGANRLLTAVAAAARRRQLMAARQDFESALQELAATPDKAKQRKFAGDPQLLQLAENCDKLAKAPTSWDVFRKWVPVLAALSAGGGAVAGYSNYQANSKRRSLEHAERLANQARESINPTFTTATLIKPEQAEPTETSQSAARHQLEALLASEYAYL